MATAWPATIPDDMVVDGFSESPPDNLIRQSMATGPPKVRPRSTAGIRPLSGKILMTTAQVALLDTLYISTLASGSLPVEFDHPRTGSTEDCIFAAPPQYTPAGGDYWWVSLQLEVLP